MRIPSSARAGATGGAIFARLGRVASMGATAPSGSIPQSLVVEGESTFSPMFVITSAAADAPVEGGVAGAVLGAWAYRLVCCSGDEARDAAGCC